MNGFNLRAMPDVMPAREVLVMNPGTARKLRKAMPAGEAQYGTYAGFPIVEDPHCPPQRPTGRTIFPQDRFVEYEESDAAWAVPLGIAQPEMADVIYRVREPKLPQMPISHFSF